MLAVNDFQLVTADGQQISALTLSGSPVYTKPFKLEQSGGVMAFFLKEAASVNVAVAIEYANEEDGTYGEAYSSSAGVLTADANIVTALNNVTRYVRWTPAVARWGRLKFTFSGSPVVTAKAFMHEEV